MFKQIVLHELKNILFGPKFNAAFITCSMLILLSVAAGIIHFNNSVKNYETVVNLTNQEMREQKDWLGLTNKVIRKPDPLQIFASGISDDIGRFSKINSRSDTKLTNSVYSDDPVYSIFRFIDFTFIVTVVLSLFALLFTYDLINGEAESGTLQLVFSNPVPRAKFILAKLAGTWLGLVTPMLIPLLLTILLLLVFRIPMNMSHWLRLFALYGLSILLYTFFISLGALISTLTKRSQVSFLLSLVCWICFVFILPRIGVILAGQIVPVPSVAEVESAKDANEKNMWDSYFEKSTPRWAERNKLTENMSKEEKEAFREAHMWQWMEEEETERKRYEAEIEKYNEHLTEERRNRNIQQEKFAFLMARLSPVSAFQIAAMNIAETDLGLKTRYEDAMNSYKKEFSAYIDKKRKENGAIGGVRITVSSDAGIKIESDRNQGALNISDMPVFTKASASAGDIIKAAITDAGIILLSVMLSFALSFYTFLKYDVR